MLGKTQEELATVAGTTKQAIYKYETGIVTNIPLDKIELLARALETTPAHLLGWEAATNKPVTISDDRLKNIDDELYKLLSNIRPEDVPQVRAFVQWLVDSRNK